MMIQTELRCGNSHTIVWLPIDKRVREGSVVSFVKGGERWKVVKQYTPQDEKTIQRGWGLDLPVSIRTER